MSNLLRELDHGPAALPRNSEVVMFNRLETEQQQAMLSVRALLDVTRPTMPCLDCVHTRWIVGLAAQTAGASLVAVGRLSKGC